ncbi:hypothetical protein M5689_006722 [Euphorbia peplus]|nr:hypothetical protein M5689_006722 [Euphorbia peplus]
MRHWISPSCFIVVLQCSSCIFAIHYHAHAHSTLSISLGCGRTSGVCGDKLKKYNIAKHIISTFYARKMSGANVSSKLVVGKDYFAG